MVHTQLHKLSYIHHTSHVPYTLPNAVDALFIILVIFPSPSAHEYTRAHSNRITPTHYAGNTLNTLSTVCVCVCVCVCVYLDVIIVIEKKVVWLYVSVDNLLRVHCVCACVQCEIR